MIPDVFQTEDGRTWARKSAWDLTDLDPDLKELKALCDKSDTLRAKGDALVADPFRNNDELDRVLDELRRNRARMKVLLELIEIAEITTKEGPS